MENKSKYNKRKIIKNKKLLKASLNKNTCKERKREKKRNII